MSKRRVRIKKGDFVRFISGGFKGQSGKVIKVNPYSRSVQIEGIGVLKKKDPRTEGGMLEKQKFFPLFRVAFCGGPAGDITKIGVRCEDGKRVRFSRKTGLLLEV